MTGKKKPYYVEKKHESSPRGVRGWGGATFSRDHVPLSTPLYLLRTEGWRFMPWGGKKRSEKYNPSSNRTHNQATSVVMRTWKTTQRRRGRCHYPGDQTEGASDLRYEGDNSHLAKDPGGFATRRNDYVDAATEKGVTAKPSVDSLTSV